jgi:hypothetical protein
MIGMSTPFSEDHVYKKRAPANMKRLKSLLALVGNLAALTFNSVVVIHDHRINAQFYNLGAGDMKPPNKQLIKYLIEHKTGNAGQLPKKTLDLVRGSHLIGLVFKQACVSFILFALIKTAYGHICTIYKKRNDLFYKLLQL